MTTTLERYANLARKLHHLTENKLISWSDNPFDNSLECEVGKFTVSVGESENSSGSPYIFVRVKNRSGTVVDSFTDETLSGVATDVEGKQNFWLLLSDLTHQAYRQVTGADEALDTILRDLDSKDLF